MFEARIDGAAQFARLAVAVRKSDDRLLRKKFYAGLNRAAKPLKPLVKAGAARLPEGGGLSARVARTRLRVKRRTRGADAGITIVAQKNVVEDPLAIDRGRVRHPTYGHRPSVIQLVKPGWFTEPLHAGAPIVRAELVRVMDEVATDIARAAG